MAGYQPPVNLAELGPHWDPFVDRLAVTPALVEYVRYVGLGVERGHPGTGLAAAKLALERAVDVQAAFQSRQVIRTAPGVYVRQEAA